MAAAVTSPDLVAEVDGPSRSDAFGAALHAFFQPTVDVAQTIRTVVAHQQALNHEIETLNHKMGVAAGLATPQQQRQLESYVQKLRVSKQRVEALGKLLIAVKGRLWKVHSALQNKTRALDSENAALASANNAAAEGREREVKAPETHKDPNEATANAADGLGPVVREEEEVPAPVEAPAPTEIVVEAVADAASIEQPPEEAAGNDDDAPEPPQQCDASSARDASEVESPLPEEAVEAPIDDGVSAEPKEQVVTAPSTPRAEEHQPRDNDDDDEECAATAAAAIEAVAQEVPTTSAQDAATKEPPKGSSNKGPKGGRGKKR